MLGFPLLAQTALAAGDPDKSVRIFTAAASFPWAFVRSLERLFVLLLSWQTFGEQTVVEGRSVVLLKSLISNENVHSLGKKLLAATAAKWSSQIFE